KIVEGEIYTLREEINSVGASVYYKELPAVTGYASDLQTLFQVLISNAIKFRRPGTKPVIEISAASNNNCWSFSIKDNGIGIEKIYLDKLFRFFQRLHHAHEYAGTGMGLAVAKKIVSLHGGSIRIESVPGQGTTVHFTILR
ncbi:MAG: ATP-binding protein, partial [Bacteroidota bacterium]